VLSLPLYPFFIFLSFSLSLFPSDFGDKYAPPADSRPRVRVEKGVSPVHRFDCAGVTVYFSPLTFRLSPLPLIRFFLSCSLKLAPFWVKGPQAPLYSSFPTVLFICGLR